MSFEWSETEFNARMRAALRAQGYRTIHVREADINGVSDLIVWKKRQLVAWIELKLITGEQRAAQIEFMREVWNDSQNAYWAVFDPAGRVYWQPGFFAPEQSLDWFEHASEGVIQTFTDNEPVSPFAQVFKFFNTKYGVHPHGR